MDRDYAQLIQWIKGGHHQQLNFELAEEEHPSTVRARIKAPAKRQGVSVDVSIRRGPDIGYGRGPRIASIFPAT